MIRFGAFMAVVMVLAVPSVLVAQTTGGERLAKDVQELRARVDAAMQRHRELHHEHEQLSGAVIDQPRPASTLETYLNQLSESVGAAGTTVESEANPIDVFGEFRTRLGFTTDRDFGIQLLSSPGDPGDPGNPAAGSSFGSDDFEDDEGTYVDARFLLGFDFSLDRDVTVRFSMQANGLFDNANTPAGDSDLGQVNVYEAWIDLRNLFGRRELAARTGRQEIVLGNEFQFGNNDFFSGETFDGTHWTWEADRYTVHFLLLKLAIEESLNTRDHPYPSVGFGDGFDDDELYSLYFTWTGIEDHVIDIYWIYLNGHNGGSFGTLGNGLGSYSLGDSVKKSSGFDFYYHTIGARVSGVFPDVVAGLDYNVEVAYQFGDLTDGTDVDVDGLAVEAEVGITLDASNHLRIFGRYLYVQGANGNDNGYIPLFTERHSYGDPDDHTAYRARYGIMDIIPLDNVISGQIGLTFDPAPDWTLGATVLFATHDSDPIIGGSSIDHDIGWEVDAFAEYRHSDELTLSFGLGLFFPDESAPLKNGGFAFDDDDVAVLVFVDARVVF